MLTRFPGFEVPDEEAKRISEPASRILANHPGLAEAIVGYSDVTALLLAVAGVTVPRVLLYKAWIAAIEMAQYEAQNAPRNPPGATMPPFPQTGERNVTPSSNGSAVNMDDLRSRLQHE